MRINFINTLTVTASLLLTAACNTVSQDEILSTHQALIGEWSIEYIENVPVFDRSPATLNFAANNSFNGNGSCNQVMSSYQLVESPTAKLSIKSGAVTKKMCPEAFMKQEQRYLKALPKVTGFTVENGMLKLTDDENNTLFVASKIMQKNTK